MYVQANSNTDKVGECVQSTVMFMKLSLQVVHETLSTAPPFVAFDHYDSATLHDSWFAGDQSFCNSFRTGLATSFSPGKCSLSISLSLQTPGNAASLARPWFNPSSKEAQIPINITFSKAS